MNQARTGTAGHGPLGGDPEPGQAGLLPAGVPVAFTIWRRVSCCHGGSVIMRAGRFGPVAGRVSWLVRDWCPSPASRAAMMAWARSATCSLARMLDTWLRMVLGLRDSRVAIAVLAWALGEWFQHLAFPVGGHRSAATA